MCLRKKMRKVILSFIRSVCAAGYRLVRNDIPRCRKGTSHTIFFMKYHINYPLLQYHNQPAKKSPQRGVSFWISQKNVSCLSQAVFPGRRKTRRQGSSSILPVSLTGAGYTIIVLAPLDAGALREEDRDGLKIYRFPYFYPEKSMKLAYGEGMFYNIRRSPLAAVADPVLFLM